MKVIVQTEDETEKSAGSNASALAGEEVQVEPLYSEDFKDIGSGPLNDTSRPQTPSSSSNLVFSRESVLPLNTESISSSSSSANPTDPLLSSSSSSYNLGISSCSVKSSGEESLSPEQARLQAQLKTKGLELRKMLGDGNCLFRAVSAQIYGDPEWHGEIRVRIVDYLEMEESYFSRFVTGDYKTYVNKMRQDGCFGSNVELQAMAEVYNRAVEVYGFPLSSSSSSSSFKSSTSSSSSSQSPEGLKPINTFQSSYTTSDPPIRLAYTNGNHYDAVIDPYEASIGVGLGLPNFNPGAIEKENMKKAFENSKRSSKTLDKHYSKKKMYLSDREATESAIEEAAIAASLRDYWHQQNEAGKRRRPVENEPCSSSSKKLKRNNATSDDSQDSAEGEESLLTMMADQQAKLTRDNSNYPPVVTELILNGFSAEAVLEAYKVSGDNFDFLLSLLLRES